MNAEFQFTDNNIEEDIFSSIESVSYLEESMKPVTHYKLDDGRLWNMAEGKFVDKVPEGEMAVACPDENGNSTLQGLIGCLNFYKLPLGDLATN